MSKKQSKRKRIAKIHNFYLYFILSLCTIVLAAIGITIKVNDNLEFPIIHPSYTVSDEPVPAVIVDDKGEITIDDEIPTMEEVDGGQFKDKDTGVSVTEGMYSDLGWSEWYNTSSPEAFKDDTLNKCIYANNYYGAQCVSLARVFWWSYADRDVSTCGTGMAKGMMNCAEENAGDDFLIYWADSKDQIQAGDWLVFDGGQFGHVGMALGPVTNGYVALLGENQGGRYCEGGGAATNIINLNIKNLIGFYRPVAYIKPDPEPEPQPVPDNKVWYTYKQGDTFGQVLKDLELDEGHLWGDDGTVNYYTDQLWNTQPDIFDANGNIKIGVPFYLIPR